MKSLLAVLVLSLSLIAVSAHAATITVETNAACSTFPCAPNNDGQCTFGEAILAINGGADNTDCQNEATNGYNDDDTIHLPTGETLRFDTPDHASVSYGPTALPTLSKSVTVRGHGATLLREGPESQPTDADALRFFEIVNNSETESGPQVRVVWDETTFDSGNPDCYCPVFQGPFKGDFLDNAPRALCSSSSDTCYSGGAGYIHGNGIYATFDKTTFKDNQTRIDKAYLSPLGGAVFVDSGNVGMATFSRSLFLNNRSPAGGAVYAGIATQLSVFDSTFAGNRAQVERNTSNDDDLDPDPSWDPLDTADAKMGGAIYAEGPVSSINNSAFYSNQGGVGGALALRGASTTILNSTFFANLAEVNGGAIAVGGMSYRDLAGPPIPNSGFSQFAEDAIALLDVSPTVTIEHATIVENTVTKGSLEESVTFAGGGVANLGDNAISLKNTILVDNTAIGGATGANCHGTFASQGHNDLNWPAADPSCVITPDASAAADLSVDPALLDCSEDATNPGGASCDPDTASPMIEAAAACPLEDQHHTDRAASSCTVGAIEVAKPIVLEGSVCGDGTVDDGEGCDEGEAHNSDLPNASCRTDCTPQRCGDGIVDTDDGEGCDGGATCFECTAAVVPTTPGCGISAEDLLDPALKTSGDVVQKFGMPAVEKCLQVFGGGSCSLNASAQEDASPIAFVLLGIAGLILPCVRRLGLFSRL